MVTYCVHGLALQNISMKQILVYSTILQTLLVSLDTSSEFF